MVKEQNAAPVEERVLICVADGNDADDIISNLVDRGIEAECFSDLSQLWLEVRRGAGALILSEESVRNGQFGELTSRLAEQVPWSDLPLILTVRDGEELWKGLERFYDAGTGGNITLIESPVRKISLVNAVQVALRARRRQYDVRDLIDQREAILASIRDPFVMLDQELRFTYVNDRAAEVRGRERKDLLGQPQAEMEPEILDTPYHKALQEAVNERARRSVEHYDSATDRWYEMRIYPSRAGVAVFGSDITERKEAEEALRQSEERLRLMVESAVEYAIFSMDCAGVITSWNAGAERILGYSEDEIIGRPMDLIYIAEDRANGVPAQERDRAELRGQAEDERWHVRKDGSKFWAGGQVMSMVDADGDVRGYVKILRDYTGRKRDETWLMALNETLEKRVAERTAEAEHRATQLQMLAAELTEAEERERRRLAELLHDHLQQILVAAKMQVGMLIQRPLDDSITDTLNQVDSLLRRSIDASRSLTVELSPPVLYDAGLTPAFHWLARRMLDDHGLQVTVDADEESDPDSENLRAFLFQAVRELLFNIVKHAGVKKATVALRRINDHVEARVMDKGAGFDAGGKKSSGQRGGFGLFSIGERVGLLGGRIEIEAAPGQGTSICVRVPLLQPDRQPARATVEERLEPVIQTVVEKSEPPIANGIAGRIRILLADDHKILREGLAGLLREQPDFDVVSEASDGQMAVDMARETEPDVIIMDVSMPRLNGIEATRRIKSEMPGVRVIALSMHAQEDMADAMRQAGAIAYMTKGVPSEILTAAIRDAAMKPERAKSGAT